MMTTSMGRRMACTQRERTWCEEEVYSGSETRNNTNIVRTNNEHNSERHGACWWLERYSSYLPRLTEFSRVHDGECHQLLLVFADDSHRLETVTPDDMKTRLDRQYQVLVVLLIQINQHDVAFGRT